MGLGDGTRRDGTSSLDLPTGTLKYGMGPPDPGQSAAKRERKSNDLIDRNLQRAMRNGTPQERIQAGRLYQERSATPGYQQGGGISADGVNDERDRKTGEKFTAEGLRLEGKDDSANAIESAAGQKTSNASSGSTYGTGASVAAPTASVAPTATAGAATSPVATGGAASGTPAIPDWQQQRNDALDGKKKQFAIEKFGKDITDWTVNDPKDQGKKSAQIFEYGKSLGISPEQIEAQADKARNGQVAEAKEMSKYQATDAQKAEGATDDFAKAYGNYLNGAGKKATKEEKDAKYAELKSKAVDQGFVPSVVKGDNEMSTNWNASVKTKLEKQEANDELSTQHQQSMAKAVLKLNEAQAEASSRPENFKKIDDKAKATSAIAEKAYQAQKKQTDDYFSDVDKIGSYNSSVDRNPLKSLFMDRRVYPDQPVPINYDTFDESKPNSGQDQSLYQSVHGSSDSGHGRADKKDTYSGETQSVISQFVQGVKAPSRENLDSQALDALGLDENSKAGQEFLGRPQQRVRNYSGNASIDNKSQQRTAAYRAPINDVLERSNFLQRFSVTV